MFCSLSIETLSPNPSSPNYLSMKSNKSVEFNQDEKASVGKRLSPSKQRCVTLQHQDQKKSCTKGAMVGCFRCLKIRQKMICGVWFYVLMEQFQYFMLKACYFIVGGLKSSYRLNCEKSLDKTEEKQQNCSRHLYSKQDQWLQRESNEIGSKN